MGFAQHIDYPAGASTLGSSYTSGAGSVVLASGTGSRFGTPTPTNPLRFTVASAITPSTCTHYQCTGISTDTLTGVTVLSGTDRNYAVGDTVYSSIYAEDFNDLQAAVTALEASATPIASASGALDFSAGDWFTRTLNGTNGTITATNLTPGKRARIELTQDATGGHSVTWSIPGAVYVGSTAPVQTSTALATDIYEVECPSSGVVYIYAVKQNLLPSTVTWTHVQSGSAHVSSGTVSVTLTGVAAGDLIVVGTDSNAFRPTGWGVSASGFTFSNAGAQNDTVTGGLRMDWAQATSTGNATFSGPGFGYCGMVVDQYHPSVPGTIVLDNANGSAGAASTSVSSGPVSISGNDSMVATVVEPGNPGVAGGGTNTPSSGYTIGSSIPTPSSGNIGIASAYKLNVSTGPEDPGWTLPDGNQWACIAAAFKIT